MVSDMKTRIRFQNIERQIAQIKEDLAQLGPLHPGSLSRRSEERRVGKEC
jgi:hypothetical protein